MGDPAEGRAPRARALRSAYAGILGGVETVAGEPGAPSRPARVPGVAGDRGRRRRDGSPRFSSSRPGRGEAVPHVIADSQNSDSDDDGQFVVEAAPPPSEVAGLEAVSPRGWASLSLHPPSGARAYVGGTFL